MSNDYFESSGVPATRSPGASSPIRAEFNDIELGFDKMPTLTGNASKPVVVNASATALTTVAALGPAQGGTGASTAFTEGSVIFAGAAGAYSQNNANFLWNNAGLALGIGATAGDLVDGQYALLIKKPFSFIFAAAVSVESELRDGMLSAGIFQSYPRFSATPFGVGGLVHFSAGQNAINGATITGQYGFFAGSTLIGATNNYGFRSAIPAGTGRWNYYADGTANNAYAGNTRFGGITVPTVAVDVTGSGIFSGSLTAGTLTPGSVIFAGTGGLLSQNNTNLFWDDTNLGLGIGTATGLTDYRLRIHGTLPAAVVATGVGMTGELPATISAWTSFSSAVGVNTAATFVLNVTHFVASQAAVGAANILQQQGFYVSASMTGGSTVIGFISDLAAATGRWNFQANGTANNAFRGNTRFGSVTAPTVAVDVTGVVLVSNYVRTTAPVTKTADFTVAVTENYLANNKAGSTCTVTLPAGTTFTGRIIRIKNLQAFTVVSASANVVPLAGGAAATAILPATIGAWCDLVSNGTNWEIYAVP